MQPSSPYPFFSFIALSALSTSSLHAEWKRPVLPNGWQVHDMSYPLPPTVTPGKTDSNAPSDAIVLFDGSDFSAWHGSAKHNGDQTVKWKLENGYMEITPTGGISTKQKFRDIQLHIEWATPLLPKEEAQQETAQRRGNSGIFLMGSYEIQIMDAWENTAYPDGMAGAVYGQSPALVNVSKKPGEWQSYDIIFTAPIFKDKKLVTPGQVTVLQNGVLVQNHTKILGATKHNILPEERIHADKMPIHLQNHGQAVRFRNIWVREIAPRPTKK